MIMDKIVRNVIINALPVVENLITVLNVPITIEILIIIVLVHLILMNIRMIPNVICVATSVLPVQILKTNV